MEKKIVLLGLVAAGLLLTGLIPMPNIVEASATQQWTGLSGPYGVAIGDYDNDGLNDLAFTERDAGRVTVYKSDGTTVIKQWTGLVEPRHVAIGDYDNDSLNDLAFVEYGVNGNVTVYKSDGTTIIKQWTGVNSPYGVAIGDYDNDGLNDLAFAEQGDWGTQTGKMTVYKSDGTTVIKNWTGLYGSCGVAIGDYNNDGLNELAFAEYGAAIIAGKVTVYKSDGTTIIKQWTGLAEPYGVAIGDYNNDCKNDIALVEYDADKVTVYYATAVGGIWVPVDKFVLLAPYIALASTILVATAATAIYVKHAKRRKERAIPYP